jgi:hypothetical protein
MRGKIFLKVIFRVNLTSGLLSLLFLICFSSHAEEIRYPVPCYEGKELKKVRQWEKTWVGQKIDSMNIDKVKDFIPESLCQMIKDPETWGESWFEIVPYKEIKPSKGELAFTRKYAGTCRIGTDDKLLNHICGIPFPSPKTGLEIAHNFDNLFHGDNTRSLQDLYFINGKSRYDRKMFLDNIFLYFTGRREIPPVPEILPNERRIFMASHCEYREPASMKGSRGLFIRWEDRTKDPESWSFSSTTRKLTRRSTAQKQTTQGGGDVSGDDQNIYSNAISFLKYKYIGRKELLLARHQETDQLKKGHREGYCLFDGFQRERIKTYVLECIHKNPNYLYSKQIWYMDPETWYILYADKYDKQGRLWRVFENANCIIKSIYNDALIGTIGFILIIDVKRLHSSGGFGNFIIGETGQFHQPYYYTSKSLLKYGY